MRKWLILSIFLCATPVFAQNPPLPAAVCQTVKAVRGTGAITSAAQIGAMLNLIAWQHRAEGYGLSRKDAGNNCPSVVGLVACDILQLPAERGGWMFDIFGSSGVGEPTSPSCGDAIGSQSDPSRHWVAAADPGTTVPGPAPTPVPVPVPAGVTRAELDAAIAIAKQSLRVEFETEFGLLEGRIEKLEQRPLDLAVLGAAIDSALLGYEVNGKTRQSFGHQHVTQLGLTKRR